MIKAAPTRRDNVHWAAAVPQRHQAYFHSSVLLVPQYATLLSLALFPLSSLCATICRLITLHVDTYFNNVLLTVRCPP